MECDISIGCSTIDNSCLLITLVFSWHLDNQVGFLFIFLLLLLILLFKFIFPTIPYWIILYRILSLNLYHIYLFLSLLFLSFPCKFLSTPLPFPSYSICVWVREVCVGEERLGKVSSIVLHLIPQFSYPHFAFALYSVC